MAVSATMRFHVLERDGFTCQYCGKKAPEANLHVDHLVPKSLGGKDSPDNLVAACKKCNRGKGTRTVTEPEPSEDIERRKAALAERRALLECCAEEEKEILALGDEQVWRVLERWLDVRGERPKNGKSYSATFAVLATVRSLLARLPFEEVLACVDITLARHHSTTNETTAIKYLYGVVRNREHLLEDKGVGA